MTKSQKGTQDSATGGRHFTRAEYRYGLFFRMAELRSQRRLPSNTPPQRICFPTIAECIEMAERLKGDGWIPDSVWDYRTHETVHSFDEAP